MFLRRKTIEDLLDLEEVLHLSVDEEEEGSLHQITSLYEELYRKISSDRTSEYTPSLDEIKKKLIAYLVRYGTYLKTQYQKDDYAAENSLKKAIKYNREIPIAYYRLGFLNYKKKNYLSALVHFQNANRYQEACSNKEYRLTDQQLYNAYLYLSNSALYMAQEAQDSLQNFDGELNRAGVPNLEMSPLYEIINRNERYLEENSFTVLTLDGEKRCTKEECEEKIYTSLPGTLILYFSDRQHSLIYNGREKNLSVNHAEMLRYFLLETTEQAPAKKDDFFKLLESTKGSREIQNNTFIQAVRRLRRKLDQAEVPNSVIDNRTFHGQTAYYYNQTIPFHIIHRSDETFILER